MAVRTDSDIPLVTRLAASAAVEQPSPEANETNSEPAKSELAVACAGYAAATSAIIRYLCKVNGKTEEFDSTALLICKLQLLNKFRCDFSPYQENSPPDTDCKLRALIISHDEMKASFLQCNNVRQQTDGTNSRVQTVFNPLMACGNERLLLMSAHDVSCGTDILRQIPKRIRNIITLSDASFYYSIAEKKLICFACGGEVKQWHEQWQGANISQVYARLYPSCLYVLKTFSERFVAQCQQTVALAEDEPHAPALTPTCIVAQSLRVSYVSSLRCVNSWKCSFGRMRWYVRLRTALPRGKNSWLRLITNTVGCLQRLSQALDGPVVQLVVRASASRIPLTTGKEASDGGF